LGVSRESIEYNKEKEGSAIRRRITAGMMVQTISNPV